MSDQGKLLLSVNLDESPAFAKLKANDFNQHHS